MSTIKGIILNPSPGFYNEPINLNISIDNSLPANERPEFFLVTDNGIPPALARYICYDSLNPPNPFIATVEDGKGNILLDGGFPKFFNSFYNKAWKTYNDLSPSFKYLHDAIDFISNKQKVAQGNKKVLVLGDHGIQNPSRWWNIDGERPDIMNGSYASDFKTSLEGIFKIKGYTGTYKSRYYYGNEINCTYQELDEYCCVLFFSVSHDNWNSTQNPYITPLAIQSLLAYRETGNGIFFITDHGLNQQTSSISTAKNEPGSYKTANQVTTNFGCYFVGNYNRSPVNVGHIRRTYGEHPLWKNLRDDEYIYAGGSESQVKVTTYPEYQTKNLYISKEGYNQIKILAKYPNGTTEAHSLIYGYKKEDVIEFKHLGVYVEQIEHNVKKQTIEFNPTFPAEYNTISLLGLIKVDNVPIGEFSGVGNNITKRFYNSNATGTNFETDKYWLPQDPTTPNIRTLVLSIDVIQPFGYTKNITYRFHKPTKTLRTSKVFTELNKLNLKEDYGLRSPQKFLNSAKVDGLIDHIDKFEFKLGRVQNYYNL